MDTQTQYKWGAECRLTSDERHDFCRKIQSHAKALLAGIHYRALTMRADLVKQIAVKPVLETSRADLRRAATALVAECKAGALYAVAKWTPGVLGAGEDDGLTESQAAEIVRDFPQLEALMPEIAMVEVARRAVEETA